MMLERRLRGGGVSPPMDRRELALSEVERAFIGLTTCLSTTLSLSQVLPYPSSSVPVRVIRNELKP